ncbi:MAG TPA: glycoside hydrolase family 32 protein [Gemmataceae bacterium]|jgi:beta-fructofuranosidase
MTLRRLAAFLAAVTTAALAADPPSSDDLHRQAVARADAADAAARPRAERDPRRPAYHFLAPARWMNDPNGPIFFGGKYHLFYQHNPYGTEWGHMHWGHAVSGDLVHWDHWPIAIAPSADRGEEHCFSGCCVNDGGTPTIVYTSIGPKTPAADGAVQWLATSTDGMRTWRKHPANPVMTLALHGDLQVKDWRDPFVWKDGADWYAVLGGHRAGGRGCALIYTSKDLVTWRFLNALMEGTEKNWECPNFFKLGDKWVLIYSPHGPVRYYTGTLTKDYRFVPEHHGTLDHSGTFYAPTSMVAPDGRRLLWGWARVKGDGWNGCLTLPRVLTLGLDGRLHIEPAAELAKLRGPRTTQSGGGDGPGSYPLPLQPADGWEIDLTVWPAASKRFGLSLRDRGTQAVEPLAVVDLAAGTLTAGGVTAKLPPRPAADRYRLRAFLDRSILEVYLDGTDCLTAPLPADPARPRDVVLTADGGHRIDYSAWPLKR